ncbi:molybdopterin converting factor subunit 1 [Gottfriedia luciferensis]|uniref:molybdopterin converting factor subunit 1 n=1 Tax=Gottfriedia luciferensis TaxID=178774 RepID=UPI000B43F6CA|nr:molybdopterin converting factor subunit 1 [Gottfriedia luciferensis]
MIKVLLFAHLREKLGTEQLMIQDKNEMSVQDLKIWLSEQYNLQSLNHVMTAINEEFVTDDEVVKDGDTVAFIPPVSGG